MVQKACPLVDFMTGLLMNRLACYWCLNTGAASVGWPISGRLFVGEAQFRVALSGWHIFGWLFPCGYCLSYEASKMDLFVRWSLGVQFSVVVALTVYRITFG